MRKVLMRGCKLNLLMSQRQHNSPYFFLIETNTLTQIKQITMKNFIHNDDFHSDLDSLFHKLEIYDDELDELPEDFEETIEFTDLEPVFDLSVDNLCEILADTFSERLTEDFEEEKEVKLALKDCIDFEKLKEKLPKLFYNNGKTKTITKSDVIDFFKN